jgi:hypothetical protein
MTVYLFEKGLKIGLIATFAQFGAPCLIRDQRERERFLTPLNERFVILILGKLVLICSSKNTRLPPDIADKIRPRDGRVIWGGGQ